MGGGGGGISSRDKDVRIPLEAGCKPDSLAYQFATVTDNQLTKFRISIWSRILYEGNVDICGTGRVPHLGADRGFRHFTRVCSQFTHTL